MSESEIPMRDLCLRLHEIAGKIACGPSFAAELGARRIPTDISRDPFCVVKEAAKRLQRMEVENAKLREALGKLTIGTCTCMTKSPEVKFHGERCTYRIAKTALEEAKETVIQDGKEEA